MLRITCTFYSERLALFFAKLAKRFTYNGVADDYLDAAIKTIKAQRDA